MNLELDKNKFTQKLMLKSNGFYESEVSDMMVRMLEPTDTFIDCGAHIGWFTIIGAELCKQVYSFEAEKANYECLVGNINLNGLKNVKAFNNAVGDECKEVELYVNLDNDGGHALWDVSHHPFNKKTKEQKTLQKLEMVTLDSCIDEPVKLIKIDTEGCELMVVKGAENLIKKYSPMIILEMNDSAFIEMGYTKSELIEYLEKLGYEGFDLKTGGLMENMSKKYAENAVFVRTRK